MPPRTPKNNPPVAKLSLTGQVGRTVTISTLGTTAGTTGQGKFKTPSQLASWKLYWGDTQQEAGNGMPPATFTHTYAASVGATVYILFTVVDVNTLTAQATLTITGMGQLPAAPTNLNAAPLGSTSILLDWTDTVANAQTYTVEMSAHGANLFAVIGTVSAPTLTFTATGLTPNTAYDFRVFGTNTLGSSGYSNIASATTDPVVSAPNVPTNVTATAISTSQINLAWTDNTGGTATYEVSRRVLNSPYAVITTTIAGATSFADTGLTAATQYFYRLRAIGVGGASPYSTEVTAVTSTEPLLPPTNVTSLPLSTTSIQVTWTFSSGATGYLVQRSLHNANTWATVGTPTNSPFTDTGLSPSTAYDYQVKATSGGGDSSFSAVTTATTFDPPPPVTPAAPTNLLATAISTTRIDLSWTDNASGTAGFEIERKVGAGSFALVATVANGVVVYSNTGLSSATSYTYRVRAVNVNGASGYSNESSATTNTAPPAAPTSLTATPTSTSTIDVTWGLSTGALTYTLQHSLHNAGSWSDVGAPVAAPPITDTGLSANTAYDYRVKATNTGGDSPFSTIASATTFPVVPPPPPAAPSNLVVTVISTTQLNLAWTDNSSNEVNFEIERKVGAGSFALVATVAAGVVTYSNTGLTSATTYTYRVRATNSNGASSYSNEASGTTLTAPPAAPTNLTATALSTTSIGLSWTASTGATSYVLERSPHNAGTFVAIATQAGTAFTDTGLTANTSYDYRVKATNTGGSSPYSTLASATTFAPPPTAPAPPSNLVATAVSTTQINLTWTDNSTNETNFEVQQKVGTGSFTTIATLGANVSSYSSVSLTPSTTYTYQVRATNAVGPSAYSNQSSATTQTAPPSAPTNLGAVALSTSSIALSWTAGAGAVNYTVERSPHSAGTFVAIATVTGTSYTDTGLAASTSYDYRVKGNNGSGSSPYSNIASATTQTPVPPPTPPAAPSALTATVFSTTQINLAWTDNSSDETNFQIERKLTTGGTFALISTVASGVVAYSDGGLAVSTSYTYRVRAVNAAGASAYTNEATAVTLTPPPPPVPNPPSNLTATNPTQTSLFIAWTDNSNDETGFSLERAVGSGTFALIQTLSPNITSYLDNVLTAATTYRYRIRAFNANGNSAYSNIAQNTTLAAPPPVPTAPSNLTATQTGNTVTLTWHDNSTNEVGFSVERRISGGTFAQIAQPAAGATSYVDGTVTSHTYDYRVFAFNGSGSSAASNTATVTVVITPPSGVPNKALWQPTDFTLLGVSYSAANNSRAYGMTGMREGGVFKLLEWVEDDHVYKYVPPTPSLSQFYNGPASPTGLVNMGVPYGTYNGQYLQNVAGDSADDFRMFALLWDDTVTPPRLYFTTPTNYDNTFQAQPVIGYATWNGTTLTPKGLWALSPTRENGGYGNRWAHCMGFLPDWFKTNFAGGRRLWVGGSGGYFVSIVGNNVSMGPTLFAMNDLAGTEPWKSVATSAAVKPLLFFPYHSSDLTMPVYPSTSGDGYLHPPRIARRPPTAPLQNKYMNTAITSPDDPWMPDPTATNGYFDWNGDSAPAAVWLETATKFGYIVFASLLQGNYEQVMSVVTYVGLFNGYHYWDLTVPTTTGLEPNMQVFVNDPSSFHYGGFLCVVNHNANSGPYNPNLPDSLATTNPILSATKVRVLNVEGGSTFENMAGAVGRKLSAGAYYGGGGGKPSAFRTHWLVYNPADLASQAQNTAGPWDSVDPAAAWLFPYSQRRELYLKGDPPPTIVTGAAVDDVASILYLRVYGGDLGQAGTLNRHMIYHLRYANVVATRGPQPTITCPVPAVAIPAGSTTASRQALINANPNGTAFCFAVGVHTATGTNTPKTGNTFVGQYGAIIDGTGWTRPEPDLEASPFTATDNGVTGVTIRNLTIRNMPQYAINPYRSASGWTVDHCEIDHNVNGIGITANNTITNNLIHHNTGGGYVSGNGGGTQFVNNEVNNNGLEQKFLASPIIPGDNHNLYIADNYFHNNSADGFWIDGDGAGTIVERNIFEANGRTGMTLESCVSVTVRNNTARNNILGDAILLTVSRNCIVTGNILTGNLYGIDLFLNFDSLTPQFPWAQDLANNAIHGNTTTVPGALANAYASLLTFGGVGNQTPYLTNTKNNVFSQNTYLAPNTTGVWFLWGGNKTFTTWQAVPQDAGSTIAVG